MLCGGQSAEHEVSLESAKNVIQALDADKYQVFIILITRDGRWILMHSVEDLLKNKTMQSLAKDPTGLPITVNLGNSKPLLALNGQVIDVNLDVVFPVLHGARGEDGTMQGLLEIMNIPYVGAGTLGSAVAMDKTVTKHLLQFAGIPQAKWLSAQQHELADLDYDAAVKELGLPLFVKPANTGSSVGISKVNSLSELKEAIDLAQQYDCKIILEEYIAGREIECSVLGNSKVAVSLPGEIIPHHEFYTYAAKYLDPQGATLKVPANLPSEVISQIQYLAEKAFINLCCEGMARVDFFVTPENKIYLNEVNTIPGFTQISMYPKMWEASGLGYATLIDKLIELALEKFQRNRVLVKVN